MDHVTIDGETEWEVEKVLDSRFDLHGKRQYLVLWKGWPPHTASWEDEENLEHAPLMVQQYWESKPKRYRRGKVFEVECAPTPAQRNRTAAPATATETR